ncbi:MAG: hypothetical protein LBD59_07660 [Prevotellaceae bacterium]|jgi:hypothetical protein|nr:hypothetical protein [Prevotellaceae bacterium]
MKKISVISLIILMILSVIAVFVQQATINILHKRCNDFDKIIFLQADSLVKMIELVKNSNLMNCSQMENCIVWNSATKEPVHLFTLINHSFNNTIIIRLSDTSCSTCNQKQIQMIKELPDYTNLLLISNISNLRELRIFLRENSIKQTVYWIDNQNKLFREDDISKILVMNVKSDGTILRSHYIDENTLSLINLIIKQ